MNWIDEVSEKLKKKNQILFSKNSEYMKDLIMLFDTQSHQSIVLWAFDFASESIVKLEEKYLEEKRPREALEAAKDWASGKIKMRLAQRKILDCHAFAKEIENKEDIAICHSIGQAPIIRRIVLKRNSHRDFVMLDCFVLFNVQII